MKPSRFQLHRLFAILVIACFTALSSTAGAFPPPPKPNPEEQLAGMLWRIHGELNLNGEQENLWKRAEDDTRQLTKTHREQFEASHNEIKSVLTDANGNLHTLFDKMDADRSAGEARAKENRKLWLSVYDGLDAAQKKAVHTLLLAELSKMGPIPGPGDAKCRFAPGKAEGEPAPLK